MCFLAIFCSLRDGRSIHIVSALLLQLIQTCTHTVKEDVLRIRNRANTRIIMDEDTKRQPEEGVDKEVSSCSIRIVLCRVECKDTLIRCRASTSLGMRQRSRVPKRSLCFWSIRRCCYLGLVSQSDLLTYPMLLSLQDCI